MPSQYRRPNNLPALEAILWHTNKTDTCWLWTGATQKKFGYGLILHQGRCILAHRLSWEAHNGPITNGLHVCHHCDNPPCVNPAHLFLGTCLDNMRDRDAKGRGYDRRGTKNGRAKLTPERVVELRHRFAAGEKRRNLMNEFGIGQTQLRRIANGVHWRVG